jgi:formyltetrahydrofolate deformylase
LWDLLLRHRAGELPMEIPLVVSNHETLREVADGFAVPFHHVAISPRTKPQAEARLEALLREHDVSLVILARYMQILSPEFVAKYPQRIINIHHSFLPAFSGAKPYQKAHERGVKLTGATSHYVTADLDEGPIIEQGVERLSHRHQLEDKIRIGRDVERLVLGRAVRLHLQHRVLVWKNRTAIFPE